MTRSSSDLSSTAATLAPAISTVGAGFMTHRSLFERGRQLGYQDLDFYIAGRAGVLGEVPAEVAAAGLVFFEYATVCRSWERSADIQTRSAAATDFAICAETWAASRLEPDPRWERLALLAGHLADAASAAHAPIFAGWRRRCPPDEPRLAMVHHLNSLREHRMACHAAAVIANGLHVGDAVRYRQPEMVEVFGWSNSEDDPATTPRWSAVGPRPSGRPTTWWGSSMPPSTTTSSTTSPPWWAPPRTPSVDGPSRQTTATRKREPETGHDDQRFRPPADR